MDKFLPNVLSKVEASNSLDRFENAIREYGVANACEWFGLEGRGRFAKDSVHHLELEYTLKEKLKRSNKK